MAMDKFLAEFYGTDKTASAPTNDDLEKQASVELFMKLAGEQKIDLKSMSNEKVAELYDSFQKNLAAEKTAAAPTPAALVEEAKKEFEEKRASAEKVAEADYLGRVMAHSMVNELRSITAANGGTTKVAELPPALMAHMKGKEHGHEEHKEEHKEEHHKEEKKDEHEKKEGGVKKAGALDKLGAEHALMLVKSAGMNVEEARAKIDALFTLGMQPESTKTASASNLESAVEIRALELLEKVGYPVTWAA